jgi:hypothetical protein
MMKKGREVKTQTIGEDSTDKQKKPVFVSAPLCLFLPPL